MSKKETEASDLYEPVAPAEAEAQEEISLEPADTGSGLPNPALGEIENVAGYEAKFSPRALIELRDIGELSYGAPRKIHGTDDRVQISNTALIRGRRSSPCISNRRAAMESARASSLAPRP